MSANCTKDLEITIGQPLTLISYWKFDEASGSRADSHGSNNLGLAGAPPPNVDAQAGIIANGTLFNLTTQAQLDNNSPTPQLWDFTAGITVAGWLFFDAAITLCANPILTCPSANGSFGIAPTILPPGGIRFFGVCTVPFQSEQIQFATNPTGAWFFVRFWHDPADNKLHGRLNEGGETTSNAFTPFDPGINSLLRFARACGGVPVNCGHDEFGIWRGVMTDAQGAFLYNGGVGRTYPDVPGI